MDAGPLQIETARLILRRWRRSDLAPFAALNADPEVMEFFPSPLDRERSDAVADHCDALFDDHGYGLFAVEVRDGEPFVGIVGLSFVADEIAPGGTEVGWRLARSAWGRGYASEAARASLAFGFEQCGLPEIVSFTSALNVRSQRVMERIGMHRDPADDFDHPRVERGHPLERHVLYRLSAEEWSAGGASATGGASSSGSSS
jgi:RimJ/RimL family protein N-acetyltransferase